ncbi:MAG: hypothetical protein ACKVW3_00415 [Phycisphaerales bacterium]
MTLPDPAPWPYPPQMTGVPHSTPPRFTVVFVHIPKTAGISLREALLANTIPHPSFRILHPIDDHTTLGAQKPHVRASLGLVEGHLYYGVHELLSQPTVYVTMLRHPVERALSYYSFIREWQPHHLYERVNRERLSLLDCFRTRLTVELDNFMVRCLTSLRNVHVPFGGVTREMLIEAKAHLDSIAGLGITESFADSLRYLSHVFGWPASVEQRLNTTTERLRRDALSADDLDAIMAHNALDAELHAYGKQLFDARLARAFGPAAAPGVENPVAPAPPPAVPRG